MVERSEHLGFALEASEIVGILREGGGEDFEGHVAVELGVAGPVDFAHAASAEGSGDFVGAESGAGGEGHEGFCILPRRR